MGIPGLMQDLLPYAEEIILGGRDGESALPTVRRVVIDGPSLVYYIYYRLHPRRDSSGVGVDSQPSYTEINHRVLEFLAALTSRQIDIQAIYFDGALPAAKQGTRLDRLEKARRSLENYRKQEPGPFEPSHSAKSHAGASCSQSSIWRKSILASGRKQLPPPPFMVACVFEDLRNTCKSKYPVEMVPGEADSYCATVARSTGAAILSSDSDMTMYDLCPEGSLVLLDSLDLVSHCSSGLDNKDLNYLLKGRRLNPVNIAKRLKLIRPSGKPSLLRYGFERLSDPSAPAGTIRSRCTSSHSKRAAEAFQQFCELYQDSKETDPTLDAVRMRVQLDPRLSELYCQYNYEAYMAQPMQSPHIYLPLIIEDPTRDSSWTYGRAIRILGYSMLELSAEATTNVRHLDYVIEFQKRGPRIAGMPLKLLNRFDLVSLMDTIKEDLVKHISGGDVLFQWRIFALKIINEEKTRNCKPTVPSAWATEFLHRGYVDAKLSWDDIHIYANIQAVLYSLWILQQACIVSKTPKDLKTTTNNLSQILKSLGPLKSLMASRWEISDASFVESDAVAAEALGSSTELQRTGPERLGNDNSTSPGFNDASNHESSKLQSNPQDQRRHTNGNIFELLPSS